MPWGLPATPGEAYARESLWIPQATQSTRQDTAGPSTRGHDKAAHFRWEKSRGVLIVGEATFQLGPGDLANLLVLGVPVVGKTPCRFYGEHSKRATIQTPRFWLDVTPSAQETCTAGDAACGVPSCRAEG